jgi:hypothetical protein
MWTITLTAPDGTATRAHAVTRMDALVWARQYRAPGERVRITPPSA